MSSVRERVLDILKKPQLSSFASLTENDKPWVRYVFTVGQEDLGVHFATFIAARKVAQIRRNPEVHLTCGVTALTDETPYLQIQGKARLVTDQASKDAFWNPGLEKIFKSADDPDYGVIMVDSYRIELCTPGSFIPEVWEK